MIFFFFLNETILFETGIFAATVSPLFFMPLAYPFCYTYYYWKGFVRQDMLRVMIKSNEHTSLARNKQKIIFAM